DVQKKLSKGLEAVPCPGCGHYQTAMAPLTRARFGRAMRGWAYALMLVPIVVVITGCLLVTLEHRWLILTLGGGTFLLGLALLVLRKVQSWFHDPNTTEVETRIALGQRSAMLRSQFEPILRAGQEDPLPALDGEGQGGPPWAVLIPVG